MTSTHTARRTANTFLRVVDYMVARSIVVERPLGWRFAALHDVAVGPVIRAALHDDLAAGGGK